MVYKIMLLALTLSACFPKDTCYDSGQGGYTSYPITKTEVTPAGMDVDDPQQGLDLARVDSITKRVVECLQQFKENPLTDEERTVAWCTGEFSLELRQCLVVKEAPDWYVSKCSGEQVFPCEVPVESCLAKGKVPTKECPCACRSIIQDDGAIITTPKLRIFGAQLVSIMTGCSQVWQGRLLECAKIE